MPEPTTLTLTLDGELIDLDEAIAAIAAIIDEVRELMPNEERDHKRAYDLAGGIDRIAAGARISIDNLDKLLCDVRGSAAEDTSDAAEAGDLPTAPTGDALLCARMDVIKDAARDGKLTDVARRWLTLFLAVWFPDDRLGNPLGIGRGVIREAAQKRAVELLVSRGYLERDGDDRIYSPAFDKHYKARCSAK